jgi:hypothetical protein
MSAPRGLPRGRRVRVGIDAFRAMVIALGTAILVSACSASAPATTGGGGGDSSAAAEPSTGGNGGGPTGDQSALEQAARASFDAFLRGDDEGYFEGLSNDCRQRLGYAAVEGYLSGRRFTAVNIGNIDLESVTVASVAIDEFDGSNGQVALVLGGTSEAFVESLPHRWKFEDGAWRLADCEDIREAPNSFEGHGTDPGDPLALGEIADIGGWFVSLAYVEPDFEAVVNPGEVEPAADGNLLVGAQLLVTYNGAEPSVVIGEHLAFDIVAGSEVYDSDDACVSDIKGLFYDPTVVASPGEDLPRPMICREVPESASSLLLRATHVATGAEYWFDLSA